MDSCLLRRVDADVVDEEAFRRFSVLLELGDPSVRSSESNVLGSSVVS